MRDTWQPPFTKVSLKITYVKLIWNLPGANELNRYSMYWQKTCSCHHGCWWLLSKYYHCTSHSYPCAPIRPDSGYGFNPHLFLRKSHWNHQIIISLRCELTRAQISSRIELEWNWWLINSIQHELNCNWKILNWNRIRLDIQSIQFQFNSLCSKEKSIWINLKIYKSAT